MRKKILLISVLLLSAFLVLFKIDEVDIEASEEIYIYDSVGYVRRDPFIVPRHHLRKPHWPASPHPFLVQLLTAETFKLFGMSMLSARLLQSLATIASTAVLMLIAHFIFGNFSVTFFSGLIFTTLPITIRYGRMAVLDPVLTLFQLLGVLWLWLLSKFRGYLGYLFAAFAGTAVALCISTKLTGIFFVLPATGWIIIQFLKTRDFYFVKAFFVFSFFMFVFFILLNDPYSYYFGWTNFSDPKHQNITLMAMIRGILDFKYWAAFIFALVGIFPVLLFFSSAHFFMKWKSNSRIILLIWIFGNAAYLLLNPPHATGLSSEWAYLPIIPAFAMVIAYGLSKIVNGQNSNKIFKIILVSYIIFTLPFTLMYGWRLRRFPLPNHARGRNVLLGDLAVTKTIAVLNQETNDSLVLLALKGVIVPLWLLNDHIYTEPMYHRFPEYKYVVTDSDELINKALAENFIIISREKNPSEPEIILLKNSITPVRSFPL